jgi:hypothetical protein
VGVNFELTDLDQKEAYIPDHDKDNHGPCSHFEPFGHEDPLVEKQHAQLGQAHRWDANELHYIKSLGEGRELVYIRGNSPWT